MIWAISCGWNLRNRAGTAASIAKHLLRCCTTLGVSEVWVGDNAPHFNNDDENTRGTLEEALEVEHRFAVSNSP